MLINNVSQIDTPTTDKLKNIINRFWPGPLTIIYKKKSYRMPKHALLLKLIQDVGPLYASSANISGEPIINNLEDVHKIFCDFIKQIIVVKTNIKGSGNASTIYDYDKKCILREGVIKKENLFH